MMVSWSASSRAIHRRWSAPARPRRAAVASSMTQSMAARCARSASPACVELAAPVVPDGLEQPVPGRPGGRPVLDDHQRLVHQPGQPLQHRVPVDRAGPAVDGSGPAEVVGGDVLRRVEVEGAGEDGQPPEHPLLAGREQAVAPVHGGQQGPVPGGQVAGGRGEQGRVVVEPVEDLLGRQHPGPGRGQLDGQRQPVQAAAQFRHRAGFPVVEGEARVVGAGTLPEQLDGGRDRERRHRPGCLAGDAEGLPAGREQPQSGQVRQGPVGELRARVEQMLAVVQHDQGGSVAELLGDGRPDVAARRVGHADRPGHPGLDELRIGQRGQIHPPDRPGRLGDPQREPGLAAAAGPGQRHQAGPGQQVRDLIEVVVAAQQLGRLSGQRGHG